MTRRSHGFTLLELMVVVGVISIIAAIAIPGLVSAQRSASERNASTSLRTVATANHDFRANDRDGNRFVDFWTGDVAGLCLIVPSSASTPPPTVPFSAAIRLLDLSMATADASFGSGARYSTSVHTPIATSVVLFAPKSGFWYSRLVNEVSAAGSFPFQVDTDGPSNGLWGACHSMERFGFLAFPNNFNSGRVAFIMGTDGIVFRSNLPGSYVATVTTGAAPTATITGTNLAPGLATFDYPNPPAGGWSKMD
jgi:prepilin-type N-terminal cleavage/methylation domain-containing protein